MCGLESVSVQTAAESAAQGAEGHLRSLSAEPKLRLLGGSGVDLSPCSQLPGSAQVAAPLPAAT